MPELLRSGMQTINASRNLFTLLTLTAYSASEGMHDVTTVAASLAVDKLNFLSTPVRNFGSAVNGKRVEHEVALLAAEHEVADRRGLHVLAQVVARGLLLRRQPVRRLGRLDLPEELLGEQLDRRAARGADSARCRVVAVAGLRDCDSVRAGMAGRSGPRRVAHALAAARAPVTARARQRLSARY